MYVYKVTQLLIIVYTCPVANTNLYTCLFTVIYENFVIKKVFVLCKVTKIFLRENIYTHTANSLHQHYEH